MIKYLAHIFLHFDGRKIFFVKFYTVNQYFFQIIFF